MTTAQRKNRPRLREVFAELLTRLQAGEGREASARAVGVSASSLRGWLAAGWCDVKVGNRTTPQARLFLATAGMRRLRSAGVKVPRRRGKPSKLTAMRIDKLARMVAFGTGVELASRAVELGSSTVREWRHRGEADIRAGDDTPYAALARALLRALAEGHRRRLRAKLGGWPPGRNRKFKDAGGGVE